MLSRKSSDTTQHFDTFNEGNFWIVKAVKEQSNFKPKNEFEKFTFFFNLQEYYQGERPQSYSAPYRHSQTDLTEWEEHQHLYNTGGHHTHRRSAGTEREMQDRFCCRNGGTRIENGDYEDSERPKTAR